MAKGRFKRPKTRRKVKSMLSSNMPYPKRQRLVSASLSLIDAPDPRERVRQAVEIGLRPHEIVRHGESLELPQSNLIDFMVRGGVAPGVIHKDLIRAGHPLTHEEPPNQELSAEGKEVIPIHDMTEKIQNRRMLSAIHFWWITEPHESLRRQAKLNEHQTDLLKDLVGMHEEQISPSRGTIRTLIQAFYDSKYTRDNIQSTPNPTLWGNMKSAIKHIHEESPEKNPEAT
jgi:hypothetical protein